MCRLSVRQFVWKYWIDYWFVCGGCRIQFDRLSTVKHCCISDCTLLYFVVDFCTSLYDAAAWYWLQVLVQWYWYLEPKYWYLYLRHGYWLVLVPETQVLVLVLVLEWLSTGYNSVCRSQHGGPHSSHHLLLEPAVSNVTGSRGFSTAVPSIWNKLPLEIRNSSSSASFKRNLKTYYFSHAFS